MRAEQNGVIRFLRGHKKLTVVLALVILVGSLSLWFLSAPIRGNLAARLDVYRGRYQVLGYGLPSPWIHKYAQCLQDRYNVRYHAVAGCVVSPGLVSYVDAYNRVTCAAANKKFGRDVFQECVNDAEQEWREEEPRQRQLTPK